MEFVNLKPNKDNLFKSKLILNGIYILFFDRVLTYDVRF